MLFKIVVLFVILVGFVQSYNVNVGPEIVATKGEVWPKPKQQIKYDTYFRFVPQNFVFRETGATCDILKTAIERYTKALQRIYGIVDKHSKNFSTNTNETNNAELIKELQINLRAPCESYPYLEMNEKYSLNVSAVSTLSGDSIWGILKGLETFSQLVYISEGYKNVLINSTDIIDEPKYPHRGLLIDTSRHYLSVPTIQTILDGMEMNKMNVLHWHIVDDQSFPYHSEVFPQLSNGAYDPSMVYTTANIEHIINYARDRGVRVIPEFDMPGHTRSWGVAFPNILTQCYSFGEEAGLGPMDPTKNETYDVVSVLLREVQQRFTDKYVHVGGDEVDSQCWLSNQQIQEFMSKHNMRRATDLHSYFMSKVVPLLQEKSKPIVWQEVFDGDVTLPNDTIVQVWKNTGYEKMTSILRAGYKVLFSTTWYLDHVSGGADWKKFYSNDPRDVVHLYISDINLNDILGGEACMWGEVVDDTNVISRIWPRASAVAEILWSGGPSGPYGSFYSMGRLRYEETERRIEEQSCRMNRRGIRAQPPNGPGFCLTEN